MPSAPSRLKPASSSRAPIAPGAGLDAEESLAEFIRALHLPDERRRNRFVGLIMPRKGRERLRVPRPFFEHLRGRFYEIRFHRDSADARPFLLPRQNPVHQVSELVEKRNHVAVFHQPRIARRRLGKITYQHRLRQQFAANPDVEVLVDRRHAERRRSEASYDPERRRGDRRGQGLAGGHVVSAGAVPGLPVLIVELARTTVP